MPPPRKGAEEGSVFDEEDRSEEDGNGTNGTNGNNGNNGTNGTNEEDKSEGEDRSEEKDCDKVDRQLDIHQNNYTFALFDLVVFIQIKGI